MPFSTLMRTWETKRGKAQRADDYLTAKQTPRSSSILAPPDLRTTYYTPLRWCYLVNGAIEERLTIVDQTTNSSRITKFLREAWRDCDGDLVSSRVHWGAGGKGRAYCAVTSNPDGSPRMTMLSAESTVHRRDPDTGELVEALHVYDDGTRAAHYEIGRTTWFMRSPDGWSRYRTEDHGYDRLQIVVFSYRAQDGYGDPWSRPIWGLQDSATRVATDGAIAGALMAVPQRVILGATQEEQKQPAEKLYLARLLTLSKSDAKITEFAAAQLQQFSALLNMFAGQAASITGQPVSFFGLRSDANPTSGDAKREDDGRVNKLAERISRDYTASWQLVLQLLLDFYPTNVAESVRRSATVTWKDLNEPSVTEQADQAVKLAAAKWGDEPLFSRRFILEQMGLTEPEIEAELERMQDDRLARLLEVDSDPGSPPEGQPAPVS